MVFHHTLTTFSPSPSNIHLTPNIFHHLGQESIYKLPLAAHLAQLLLHFLARPSVFDRLDLIFHRPFVAPFEPHLLLSANDSLLVASRSILDNRAGVYENGYFVIVFSNFVFSNPFTYVFTARSRPPMNVGKTYPLSDNTFRNYSSSCMCLFSVS